jgi:tyrosyl-tRNA synthetase
VPDDIPQINLEPSEFENGEPGLLSILAKNAFIKSTSEGRRLVQNGGLYLNEERLTDEKYTLQKSNTYIIRQGKKGKFLKIIT